MRRKANWRKWICFPIEVRDKENENNLQIWELGSLNSRCDKCFTVLYLHAVILCCKWYHILWWNFICMYNVDELQYMRNCVWRDRRCRMNSSELSWKHPLRLHITLDVPLGCSILQDCITQNKYMYMTCVQLIVFQAYIFRLAGFE